MGHRWWRLAGMDEATRAAAALSARRGALPRPADAGLGAGGRGRRCRALARARHPAGALERAEISAEGGRFHRARNCRRPRARACAGAGRGRLARGGFSARSSRARSHRRPDRQPVSPATTGCEYPFRLCRHLAGSTPAGCRRRAVCRRDRRPRRLRHRRADAAGAGAADRRRTGGADHRDLGDLHQSQPLRRLSALCRPPPRADRDPGGRVDDRARRLRLYAADQCRRGAGDRRHADIERAAAPPAQAPRRQDRRHRAGAPARSATASWSAAPRARA